MVAGRCEAARNPLTGRQERVRFVWCYLRCRILARIRRFFRPTLRRPLPRRRPAIIRSWYESCNASAGKPGSGDSMVGHSSRPVTRLVEEPSLGCNCCNPQSFPTPTVEVTPIARCSGLIRTGRAIPKACCCRTLSKQFSSQKCYL